MIKDWLSIITSSISLIGVMFLVYHFFRNPDIKAEKDISIIEKECELKHKRIDEILEELKNGIILIKENHLTHIEKDIKKISESQIRTETILETLLKK